VVHNTDAMWDKGCEGMIEDMYIRGPEVTWWGQNWTYGVGDDQGGPGLVWFITVVYKVLYMYSRSLA
jgi:hypothetical protein